MKKLFMLSIALTLFISCKDETKVTTVTTTVTETVEDLTPKKTYPQQIALIFEAHGGIENWNLMKNLCYEFDGKEGKETHTTSLKDRKSKIESKKWSIGFDGNDVWLLQNEPESYNGNARFYHNLMFYFYAMPFVIGDDGIVYTEMEPTELTGKKYNATKISFNDGVGDSPKDEYIIYSDPETSQMEWLGYTVTYNQEQKSTDWHFIKYEDWTTINSLVLPKKLTWYNVANNKPSNKRNDLVFSNIIVTKTELEEGVFTKPETATIVKK
jgi:hypothetical protein